MYQQALGAAPRSHSCAGMSKPTLLPLRDACGSLSLINCFSRNFCREPEIFKSGGSVAANSTMR